MPGGPIGATVRIPIDVNETGAHIHHPVLGDASGGIHRPLAVPIELTRGIRDFNNQAGDSRVLLSEVPGGAADDRDIGLRLGVG